MTLPFELSAYLKAIQNKNAQIEYSIDEPKLEQGVWWIDIINGQQKIEMTYQPSKGFGFFLNNDNTLQFNADRYFKKSDEALSFFTKTINDQLLQHA